MANGCSKSRSLRCAWLIAATVVTASARGDDSTYNPTPTQPTRVGELALKMGQNAIHQSGLGWTGAFSVGAAWGLWPIESLSPLTLRVELPVIEQRPGVQVGSLLATLGAGSPSLLRVGPLSLGATLELGVEAPSFGGATVEVLGNAFAEHAAHVYLAGSIPLTLRALGLSVAFWSTPFANANFEVDYAPPGRSIALRAGIGLAATDQPSRWFAGLGCTSRAISR
jgi:hypothetical protein